MIEDNSLGTLGRYKIIDEIGRGGFSVVYKAENVALKKTVAIKMMLPALFHDPESIERFIHEARTVAGLRHNHIVRVVDLDEDDARLFMALEYLPGGDLHSWIETHGRPTFRQVAGIINNIAEALDYAHGEGIVHGDVKPGNILLSEEGRAKLTDFGILRAVESSGVTSADLTRGTPYYVSPEGAEGGRPTPESDQYALGVVAYELLTGQVPFGGDTPLAIYLKHVREAPPPPSELSPLVTPELENILLKALAKDAADRYPNCQAFARALKDAVAETEIEQFRALIARVEAALAVHDLEKARMLLGNAMQIMPDDPEAQALLEQIEDKERAQSIYADAEDALEKARNQAVKMQTILSKHPDPDGHLEVLAPSDPTVWKSLLNRWCVGMCVALGLVTVGIFIAVGFTGYVEIGSKQGVSEATRVKATVVAVARTPSPTHTVTQSPTPSVPPTSTPTFTPTSTSSNTPTPTITLTITPSWYVNRVSPLNGFPAMPNINFPGSLHIIHGVGFDENINGMILAFDDVEVSEYVVVSDSAILFHVPEDAETGSFTITGPNGGFYQNSGFIFEGNITSEKESMVIGRQYSEHTFTLYENPPIGSIEIFVSVKGDYDEGGEYAKVYVGQKLMGNFSGYGCGQGYNYKHFEISTDDFYQQVDGGIVTITIFDSDRVSDCAGYTDVHKVKLQYQTISQDITIASILNLLPDGIDTFNLIEDGFELHVGLSLDDISDFYQAMFDVEEYIFEDIILPTEGFRIKADLEIGSLVINCYLIDENQTKVFLEFNDDT